MRSIRAAEPAIGERVLVRAVAHDAAEWYTRNIASATTDLLSHAVETAGEGHMRQHRKLPSFFQESLRLISYCPVCDTSYNPMEARVIDDREDKHLVHIRCKKCAHSILALVLTSGMGVSSMGLLTDLTFDDVVKFREAQPITVDDVIALHHLLEAEGSEIVGK